MPAPAPKRVTKAPPPPVQREAPRPAATHRVGGYGDKPRPQPVHPKGIIHILKESKPESRKIMLTTGCGVVGQPYVTGSRPDGIRTTCFSSVVTCPDCRLLPGVSGIAAPPRVIEEKT